METSGRRNMSFPMIRSKAPEFVADAVYPNKEIKPLALSDYLGKWVVFFWYPVDFTFVCPTEIIAFGDRQPEFEEINTQVIAISCDSKHSHLAWINTPRSEGGLGDMKIPIVSDFTRQIAIDYGVLLPVFDPEDAGVPLRALFIIDPVGNVRQVTCNDLPIGRNVDETIRLIKAFQFNAKYGEVCPANWQPGDLTMKAEANASKAYFRVANAESTAASSVLTAVDNKVAFAATVAKGLTVVDYWAPWCKNCKKITPTIEKLAGELKEYKFITVNTVEAEELAMEYKVDALPTFQFFKNGTKVGEFKGSNIKEVEAAIRNFK